MDAIRYFESMDRKKKGLDNPINGGVAIFAGGNENASLADYPGALYDIILMAVISLLLVENFIPQVLRKRKDRYFLPCLSA